MLKNGSGNRLADKSSNSGMDGSRTVEKKAELLGTPCFRAEANAVDGFGFGLDGWEGGRKSFWKCWFPCIRDDLPIVFGTRFRCHPLVSRATVRTSPWRAERCATETVSRSRASWIDQSNGIRGDGRKAMRAGPEENVRPIPVRSIYRPKWNPSVG